VVPDIEINHIINYKTPTANLSDFKEKLVILDFMNTYCLNCIEALPRFDSLQHEYGDRLQIIIVTNEAKERVGKFLKTNPVAKHVSLPVIVQDTILERLFPHHFVSHEAWVNKGIVKAITGPEYVKGENVLTVLSGKTPGWEVKTDFGDYDYDAALLTINNDNTKYLVSNNVYGSVCMPNLKGVGLRYIEKVDTVTGVTTIRAINYSIAALYLQTHTARDSFPRSHVLLDPENAGFFTYLNQKEYRNVWEEKNTYCYEATFSANISRAEINKKIQSDLDVYLKVNSRFETKEKTCYLLIQDTPLVVLQSPPEDYTTLLSRTSKNELIFMRPSDLIGRLNETFWGIPFYNGIPANLHMPIILEDNALADIPTLEKALKKQHLELKKITRVVKMLVLNKKIKK
jgi:thiol-disulfide isomerase/thioredoxin